MVLCSSTPASSSSDSGLLAVLEASDSSSSGDAMVDGHLVQPSRSVLARRVRSDVLLKTASKNRISSLVRRSVSTFKLHAPAAGGEQVREKLTGLTVISLFFRDVFVSCGP